MIEREEVEEEEREEDETGKPGEREQEDVEEEEAVLDSHDCTSVDTSTDEAQASVEQTEEEGGDDVCVRVAEARMRDEAAVVGGTGALLAIGPVLVIVCVLLTETSFCVCVVWVASWSRSVVLGADGSPECVVARRVVGHARATHDCGGAAEVTRGDPGSHSGSSGSLSVASLSSSASCFTSAMSSTQAASRIV